MKTHLLYLFLLWAFGLGMLGVAQQAAPSQVLKGTADIPFEFWTPEKKMPAGQYTLQTTAPSILVLNNKKDRTSEQIFTLPEGSPAADAKDMKLVFYQREGKYYLVGLKSAEGRQRLTRFLGATPKQGDIRREVAIRYESQQ